MDQENFYLFSSEVGIDSFRKLMARNLNEFIRQPVGSYKATLPHFYKWLSY